MYMAYKYAKKKHNQRKEERLAESGDAVPMNRYSTVTAEEPISGGTVADTASAVSNAKHGKETAKKELTPEELAEKKRRRKYRLKILLGLVAPFTLQALDMTIVASALPFIAADFNQVAQLNWIISAFNLTSAAFLPFWAQITDIFGRHGTLQATVVIMTIGSAICTGAPTDAFGVLLFGRALQGIGCSGVSISVRTILADKVSLKEYALNWTLFSLLSAITFSIGPVAGGYLTQVSWRWCFGINVPVGVLAIVIAFFLLRKDLLGPQSLPELEGRDTSSRRGRLSVRLSTIDFGGQFLFLWGLGLVILALTWAGGSYAWSSVNVLAPLIIGCVLTLTWAGWEYLMGPNRMLARAFPTQRAMMPWALISQRDIGLLFVVNFAVGMAMFSVMYFLDLYFVLVQGNDPSTAGIALLYFLPGLGVGAYTGMFFTNVWPRQTLPSLVLGGITSAVGITVLAWATQAEQLTVVYGMMALTGHGVGLRLNAGSLHGLAYFPQMTASITCLVSFALPFGGAVCLTLMSTVFNNKSGDKQQNPKDGIMWAFIAIIPFMWFTLLVTLCLGNVWIGKDGSHEVVNGSYFWSLLTGKKLVRERKTRGEGAEDSTNGGGVVVENSTGGFPAQEGRGKGPEYV